MDITRLMSVIKNRAVKVYDYNGVLLNVEGFRAYVRHMFPELARDYYDKGSKDIELKRKLKPTITTLFEQATAEGAYPVGLMPHARERLLEDKDLGYEVAVFTTVNEKLVHEHLGKFQIHPFIDTVISLDELVSVYHLGRAVKEDHQTFLCLMEMLAAQGFHTFRSYTDDTQQRIEAAVAANAQRGERPRFERIYLLGKCSSEGNGFSAVKDLLEVA